MALIFLGGDKEPGGNSYIIVHVICKHLIDNAKMAKVFKSKIIKSLTASQWGIRMHTKVISSGILNKTESSKNILTAQCLRRKFGDVGGLTHKY